MTQPRDFDLAIAAHEGGFTVRAQSGAGELAARVLALPFDLAALPRRRRDAAEWVAQARIILLAGAEELRRARAFGQALFTSLFSDEVLALFREARQALPEGERLRVRLRLPAELSALPWELLCDPRDAQFLALAPDLALVRYPELATPLAPLRVDGPLQVVVVLASPDDPGYAPINTARELGRIESALRRPREQGRVALDVIRGPGTLDQLRERLKRPAHVLHILSHGELDADEGVLIFEDADGAPEPVGAELLRQYLARQRGQTRLVLLNACLGALPAGNDPFSGLGAALVRAGVPAVIAMQFELAEDAAAELARVFYAELAGGAPVDLALAEARLHLSGRYRTRLDWAVPVLFMRAADGVLFAGSVARSEAAPPLPETPPTRQAPPDPAELPQLWQRAQVAYFTGRWTDAATLYQQVAAIDAGYQDVGAKLAEARRQLELLLLYRQAGELRVAGQWRAVLGALVELERQQPGYADAEEHRVWAAQQRRRDELYVQALAACERGAWTDVLPVLDELLAAFPDDGDAKALRTRAEAEVAAQERRAEEERAARQRAEEPARRAAEAEQRERFGPAQQAMKAGDYKRALDLMEAMLTQTPDDREAVALVADMIENAAVPLEQRLRAGRLAGQYGDPRPGVCALPQSLDDHYWCGPFAAGKYPIADGKATVQLAEFRIARYPVTVWQFRQFVEAKGYEQQQWWTDEGWKWLQPGGPRYNWQEKGRITQPFLWGDADWTAPNQPVIGVSWYEAVAFCRWLSSQATSWLPNGWGIRLPSEAEWEVAAMWDAQKKHMRPWQPPEGELWQNVEEAQIERTSPVGMFPQGASPCGALDMAGNVWEWCGSFHEDYPAKANSLRDDFPSNNFGPTLRGESYYTENKGSSWGARCGDGPGYRFNGRGFRVAVCSSLRV